MTFTKEWLQKAISDIETMRDKIPFGLDEDGNNTLQALKMALAGMEAEPVCYLTWHQGFRAPDDCEEYVVEAKPGDKSCDGSPAFPVYNVSPVPVSVPDKIEPTVEAIKRVLPTSNPDEYAACIGADMWNACRAAMLQGAENAESPSTIQAAPALDYMPKNAESTTGINQGKSEHVKTAYKLRDAVDAIRNSGIAIDGEKILAERDALNTPDCWCRTCRPITLTDMRFVVCPVCGNKRCPHANDHRNACTGSNEPGQEGSAYPAASQQEVKQ